MIVDKPTHLLFIEPKLPPTPPVVDEATCAVTTAWRSRTDGPARYRGMHSCTGRGCSAMSGNGEHTVDGRFATNSLAIHYVACHRAEIPAAEMEKIMSLPAGADMPTEGELAGKWQACDGGRS